MREQVGDPQPAAAAALKLPVAFAEQPDLAEEHVGAFVGGAWMIVLPAPAPTSVRVVLITTCSLYVPAAICTVSPEDATAVARPIVAQGASPSVQSFAASLPAGFTYRVAQGCGFGGFEHVPFAGSQVPATWH